MTESESYQAKAAQCERLARMMTDPKTVRELKELGAEFTARAGEVKMRRPLMAETAVEIGRH